MLTIVWGAEAQCWAWGVRTETQRETVEGMSRVQIVTRPFVMMLPPYLVMRLAWSLLDQNYPNPSF